MIRCASDVPRDRARETDIVGCKYASGIEVVALTLVGRNASQDASIVVATITLFQRIFRPYMTNGFPLGRP